MDKSKHLKNKVQTVQIEFSNGARGSFIGKACVSEDEFDSVSVTKIAVGLPEDITDEIRAKIMEQGEESDGET